MKPKGLLPILLLSVGCGVPMIGFFVVAKLIGLGSGDEQLRTLKREARKLDLATNFSELAKVQPAVPPDEDATTLYRELAELVRLRRPFIDEMNRQATAFSTDKEVDWVMIRARLRALDEVRRVGDEAVRLRGIQFDRKWSDGLDLRFNEIWPMRNLVSIYSWKARLLAHLGKPHEALVQLQSAGRVVRQLRYEHSIPAYSLSLTGEMATFETIKGILRKHPLTPQLRADIGAVLKEFGELPNPADYMHSYAIFVEDAVKNHRKLFNANYGYDQTLDVALNVKTTQQSLLAGVWGCAVRVARTYRDPELTEKQKRDRFRQFGVELRDDNNPLSALARRAAPAELYDYTLPLYARTLRLLMKAISDGSDQNLSAKDPFSDQRFKVIKVKNGLRIYSVGQNEADDGGEIFNRRFNDATPDKTDFGIEIHLLRAQ